MPENGKCVAMVSNSGLTIGSGLPELLAESLGRDVGDVRPSGRVCMFAFGISSTAPEMLSSYADECLPVPLPLVMDRRVPGWVGSDVDAILISCSGDEPELMEVYHEVRRRGCRIHCVTSGGGLMDAAVCDGVDLVRIPEGLTRSGSTGAILGSIASILRSAGVCDIVGRLGSECPDLVRYRDSLSSSDTVSLIASALTGKVPAVYGTADVRAVTRRWKMAMNESVGTLAFFGELPEFDHNELVGWFDPNPHAPELAIVVLRGDTRSDLLNFITGSMVEILREEGRPVTTVELEGDVITRNLRGIVLADTVAEAMAGGRR